MSAGTLRVIYVGVLSVTALWPVAQWYLVEKHDVNPWKLCGFAMYCTPHHVSLDVVDTTDGRRPLSEQELGLASNNQYADFVSNRKHLGTLCSPDALARSILDSSHDIRSLSVEIHVMQLSGLTARLTVTSKVYEYGDTEN